MRIIVTKELMPKLYSRIIDIKTMEQYKFEGYSQDSSVLVAPTFDFPIESAIEISRVGAILDQYPYWVEVPNANLTDDLPTGISYRTYLDNQDPPVEQIRTWADLSELRANQAGTATMRYWQPANNENFIYDDIEIFQESGFGVYGQGSLRIKLNKDYDDPLDSGYTEIETIEYIDQNWRFNGYFDFLHAYYVMKDIYVAKGASDIDRWNACTTEEKLVLVRWNQVGLNRAVDLVPGSWSEGRALKELSRYYREFNLNITLALEKRFNDWYQYIQLTLSTAGRTKFKADFDWSLKHMYISNGARFYELNSLNALIDWHDTILTTYVDADFVGQTITASQLVSLLRDVLTEKTYYI